MKKSKKDKQLENLLFEVYEKGVNNEDCDLTAYIVNTIMRSVNMK